MSDTQQRIDELVKGNEVLLFMKGSASFPMCGFSGRAVQILKACGVDPKQIKTSRNTASGPPFRSSTSRGSSSVVRTS